MIPTLIVLGLLVVVALYVIALYNGIKRKQIARTDHRRLTSRQGRAQANQCAYRHPYCRPAKEDL